jgi:hypothetical protein
MPVYLWNEKLKVEIGEPGELYSGSRFDNSGHIAQVTLNNRHTFCTTEKSGYNAIFGSGLINEFDIDEPIGYEETIPGEYFLKIGVGKLLREDGMTYDFSHLYKFNPSIFKTELFETKRFSVETQSEKINGFQYQYVKVISIYENILTIFYSLKNIGEKCFSTEEYGHNFLSIDYQDLSENYQLKFNFKLNPGKFDNVVDPNNCLIIGENNIGWNAKPTGDIFIAQLNGKTPHRASWQLINSQLKTGVSEDVSFESIKVNLWGNRHVVSPELFFRTTLNQGEEYNWQRRYTFFEL